MFPHLVVCHSCYGTIRGPRPSRRKEEAPETGFVSIFDGKSLKGWHVSAKSGHSFASHYKSGGLWVAEDGAITGTQDIKGNGGLLLTDRVYGDFEIALEMKNDFGPDSGLFLRSTEDGKAYQALIDYHPKGNLMGIFGEGLGNKPLERNFSFLDKPTDIREDPASFKLPISPAKWPEFWKHGEWNELRARITGNPPRIVTWIKGVKFMDYTDTVKRCAKPGRYRPSNTRWIRLHQTVRSLSQHPPQALELTTNDLGVIGLRPRRD